MRKLIFTFFLLTLSIVSYAFYYDYWNGRLYSDGPYVNEMMSEMPYLSQPYASLSKQYVTDGKVDLSVSMQIGWYNYHRKLALNHYWANWIVVGFNYDRRVYYADGNSDSYTEMPDYRVTNHYLDVSGISKRAEDGINVSSYSSQYNEMNFRENINLNVEGLVAGREYKLRVEYVFKIVPYSEYDGYHYNPDETGKYVNTQNVTVRNTATGSELVFKISNQSAGSVININGSYNPYYNTGAGERYLIYDDPDAIISVTADTLNLPCSKSRVVGTNLITERGYGSFLASIGASSVPTYVETVKYATGCGVIYYGCSRACSGVTSKSVEFLADNPLHLGFLNKKNYDTTSSCYIRYTNILTRSLDSDLKIYDENSVEEFNQSCRTDYRMSRIYHLRDLSNVVSVSKDEYKSGTILKLQHSAIYTNAIDTEKFPKMKSLLALGYTYYGPPENLYLAQGSGIVSNIMNFEIVSRVVVPRLTLQEREERLTCVTDSLIREGDIIHLKGKQISCGVYSPSLYMPVYMWEVSFDGKKWETITPENFSSYIVNRYSLKYAIIMDSEKDILLKSTILKNKQKAMFRQRVILKSFASNEISSLYNYDGKDGKYYISVPAFDYYTYIPTPILDGDNFAFSPLSFPSEQKLCKGEGLVNNKISFRLRNSNNVSTAQINKMADIVDYKIYELKDGIPSKLVSNSASYIINWKGESLGYRCVISWCRDSIFKDVWVIANPEEKMDIENINSSAVICSRDKNIQTVSILCPKGSTPTITVSDSARDEYLYFSRRVVDDVPNSWQPFSYKNYTELPIVEQDAENDIFFIKKQNIETGCESDSIKVNITYFNGIEDNVISFASAAEASKGVTYVVRDSVSPAIKGLIISGGYGSPAVGNSNVYVYRYLYREPGGIWQPIESDIVISGEDVKSVSLRKGALNVDRKYEICRVAISRNGAEVSTQVSDTSNVLTIDIIEPLLIDDVVVSGDGKCAGTKVSIGINSSNLSSEIRERTRFVWSVSDERLKLEKSGEMDEYCDIYNSLDDFSVTVYREDSLLKVRTPELVIPVKVSTVKPYFSIITNGNKEEKILDYTDESFVFQAGTRFELKNISEGADSYVWNLELQYYTGQEIEGLKSYLENPVCYLYNQGQNKIRLTARNSLGCEASVTAENLYIQRSLLRSAEATSHFEPEQDFNISTEALVFNVYPTIVGGEDVNVYYSGGEFKYLLTNSIGEILFEAEADSYIRVPFESQPQGLYQLCVWPLNGSDSAMQVYKILKK